MYKTKLQHLCQQKQWQLPSYTSARSGPDHNPAFSATVSVNGVPYSSADLSRTSKEAQNDAARIAFEHLAGVSVPPAPAPESRSSTDSHVDPCIGGPITQENGSPSQVKDDKKFIGVLHLYKNRLQSYALKNNLALPAYLCQREGPAHALRFRCKVTFLGKTVESSEFYPTIKEAEHAAAKIAWETWSLDGVQQDDSALYKNLLQEFLQRKGFPVPKFEVSISGPPHMPVFVSKVNIRGQVYEGQAASSKKQSESLAAKVAYFGLQDHERKEAEESKESQPDFTSGSRILKAMELSSSALHTVIATAGDGAPRGIPNVSVIIPTEKSEEYAVKYVAGIDESALSSPEADNAAKRLCLPDSVDLDSSAFLSVNTNNVHQQGGSSDIKILANETVVVRPRTPDMICPTGASISPFSDDKWVALKMNSNK